MRNANTLETIMFQVVHVYRGEKMEEKSGIEELLQLRKQLLERYETKCKNNENHNAIIELTEVIDIVQKRCEEISPCDCDW